MPNYKVDNAVTVDIGRTTAWACWRKDQLWSCEVIRAPKGKQNVEDYLKVMGAAFEHSLWRIRPVKRVYLEGVELWEGSLMSLTSAKRGDLMTLSYLLGVYAKTAFSRGAEVIIIPARVWKGQLTKIATAERVRRLHGQVYENDHITDAVAMGYSIMGVL